MKVMAATNIQELAIETANEYMPSQQQYMGMRGEEEAGVRRIPPAEAIGMERQPIIKVSIGQVRARQHSNLKHALNKPKKLSLLEIVGNNFKLLFILCTSTCCNEDAALRIVVGAKAPFNEAWRALQDCYPPDLGRI